MRGRTWAPETLVRFDGEGLRVLGSLWDRREPADEVMVGNLTASQLSACSQTPAGGTVGVLLYLDYVETGHGPLHDQQPPGEELTVPR